jgi:hypothetical protein
MYQTMTTTTRLSVGTSVRVRYGVADPDYPDSSIEGWAGTIVRIDDDGTAPCLVRWDGNTLENANSAGCMQCERDDLDREEMWLAEEDLEDDWSVDSDADREQVRN